MPNQVVDGVLTEQREVGDGDIHGELETSFGDALVRRNPELSAAGASRLLDELGHDVHAHGANAVCRELSHEPSLAAPNVEHARRRPAEDRFDDRAIRDERSTLDATLADGRGPRRGVVVPRIDDLCVAEGIDAHGRRQI